MSGLVSSGRNYLSKYLTTVRSKGRYAFTLEELKEQFKSSSMSLNQSLGRLKVKKEIAQIRKGFYVLIPPEYSSQGMLPPYLFIDDLMKSLNKRYYLALLSAAALWGAAHQQPMEYFVLVESPAPRSVKTKKLKLNFIGKKGWTSEGIVPHKTPSGYISVSSPELTALDLCAHADTIGLNRVVSILQELVQQVKPTVLVKIARLYSNTTAIQRLGYLLDEMLSEEKKADALWKILVERKYYSVPLTSQKEKKGILDYKWKVIVNMQIESDL